MQTPDWVKLQTEQRGSLSTEDQRILELLIAGITQPEIGRILGLHRSAVWRRIQKLRMHYPLSSAGANTD